jgi:hypothetical protein
MRRIITMLALVALATFSLGAKCGVRPQPMPVEPKDTAMCASACDQLRMLGCEEGDNLEDGTTCEQFCIDTQKSGHALRPSCVVDMTACDQLEKCSGPSREVFE